MDVSLDHSEGSVLSEDALDTEDDALDTGDDLDVSVDELDTPDEEDSPGEKNYYFPFCEHSLLFTTSSHKHRSFLLKLF